MPETLVNNEVETLTNEAVKCESTESPSTEKAAKTESNNEQETTTPVKTPNYDLNKFRLQRILNNNTRNKSIALLGNFPDLSPSDKAIVIFEKKAFQESEVATGKDEEEEENAKENGSKESVKEKVETAEEEEPMKPTYFCSDLIVQTQFINNIYGSYQCTPPAKLSGVKATVVYPATDKHIEKYSICQKFVINETPELYKEITLPYITTSQFSLEWVYNILEHKQEKERIIFEDPDPENGFILLPDLKWDGRNVENLYVLAITHKRDIKSLRDLNSSHLPLLRNIRSRIAEVIETRYGILATQLRMYFHYQPSFYHLHIHINPVRNDAPGIWCEKSHMLDTVINNLELLPDYYQKATLPFVLYDGNKLLELYEAKMTIRKALKRSAEKVDATAEEKDDVDDVKAKKPKLSEETNEALDEPKAVTN
ncbi:m7GpppX diphosphatase [Lucilia sericata]|uniref:m7GpppX diphosphatase n=1 Tax=Lucilia sericata TaxID=13632 RepID=UPI0018A82B31|nr:m7GpppX diphosphatase [Lucilia sericata]